MEMNSHLARKILPLLLEPVLDPPGHVWQGHHVTNPTVFRPSFDTRVHLGYRAGGDRDHYCIGETDVWGSSLGLAILDAEGAYVVCRFPWPILWIDRPDPLPQDPGQVPAFQAAHGQDIVVLHDFRLFEWSGFIHVVYHDGRIDRAFDCVRRMETARYARLVAESERLAAHPPREIHGAWRALWHDAWEPCGQNGRLVYPTDNHKNDIVFLETAKGLRMLHRPLPDIATVAVDGIRGAVTPDGETDLGVLESCVRPGYFDNSHIGPNGQPIPARIGSRNVFLDISHGVHNAALAREGPFAWEMTYLPYLRILDAEDGTVLYHSQEPILETDETWREYSEQGRWVRLLPHRHIVFAGGLTPRHPGRIGMDDPFVLYAGVGDTAIGQAEFTIRDLVPSNVLEAIQVLDRHRAHPSAFPEREADLGAASGWRFVIRNLSEHRGLAIERTLERNGQVLSALRPIPTAPGRFDADGMLLWAGSAWPVREAGFGLLVPYLGLRWREADGQPATECGFGLLVLDPDNPERILYRATEPLDDRIWEIPGWVGGAALEVASIARAGEAFASEAERWIPRQVLFEIRRMAELTTQGLHWRSHHTTWLRRRAGLGPD